MKRVLVTGATGFVGRQTLAPLRACGFEVHAVHCSRHALPGEGVDWHRYDLLESGDARDLVERVRPTHLVHAAWYVPADTYLESPENGLWCEASLALAEEFVRSGGRRIVGFGSCLEYAPSNGPCGEIETPTDPATPYARAKDRLRRGLEARLAGSVSFTWARLFHLYGPWEPPGRLVSDLVPTLLRGDSIPLSHGRQQRDYLHVGDAGAALARLANCEATGVVNIASGSGCTVRKVALTVADLIGRRDLLHFGERPQRPGDREVLLATIDRLRREVGWQPRLDLRAGLAETIEWWRTQDVSRDGAKSQSDPHGATRSMEKTP